MGNKYKAVIFDFGRVIWHWDEIKPQIGHAKKHGVEEIALMDEMKKYFKLAVQGSYAGLHDYFEQEKPATPFNAGDLQSLLDDMDQTTWVDEKMMDYIIWLKKNYKIGLLSNFTSDLQQLLTDELNLHHDFDEVINSYDVRMVKPDGAIYELMLTRLGVKAEEAIFVDDLQRNVDGAEAVGIKGIVHKDFESTKTELDKLLT